MARVLLERETVEGDAVTALLDNEWESYLEREVDIRAAKEERNAAAARKPRAERRGRSPPMPAVRRGGRGTEVERDAETARDGVRRPPAAMR